MTKLGRIITSKTLDISEFRGIPKYNSDKKSKFVYGNLIIENEGDLEDKKVFIDHLDANVGKWVRTEIKKNSIGQRLISGVYEGDLMLLPEYPDSVFEFIWSDSLVSWTPRVVYNSRNITEFTKLPQSIKKYKTIGYCFDFPWYPTEVPRFFDRLDYGVFLGYQDEADIYLDTKLLTSGGDVYGILKTRDVIHFGDIETASKQIPWLINKLKERRFYD